MPRSFEAKGMLNRIDKLLTGDLLTILCDMGHGDELVIAESSGTVLLDSSTGS